MEREVHDQSRVASTEESGGTSGGGKADEDTDLLHARQTIDEARIAEKVPQEAGALSEGGEDTEDEAVAGCWYTKTCCECKYTLPSSANTHYWISESGVDGGSDECMGHQGLLHETSKTCCGIRCNQDNCDPHMKWDPKD